jgi:adenosine deaminase
MINFKPDRLGHCCYLTKEQLELVHELAIPVEVCPTSNLATVPDAGNLVSHLPHLMALHALNHNIIICTDDTMLFSTNISTELFEYAKGFKVSG